MVRAETFGAKTLVHNYGHGGGGITLSWGTSHLAVDEGFAGPDRDYAVLGCGAVGLATARLIQRRGGRVTIYAKALPPDTTWFTSFKNEAGVVYAVRMITNATGTPRAASQASWTETLVSRASGGNFPRFGLRTQS